MEAVTVQQATVLKQNGWKRKHEVFSQHGDIVLVSTRTYAISRCCLLQ